MTQDADDEKESRRSASMAACLEAARVLLAATEALIDDTRPEAKAAFDAAALRWEEARALRQRIELDEPDTDWSIKET